MVVCCVAGWIADDGVESVMEDVRFASEVGDSTWVGVDVVTARDFGRYEEQVHTT